MIIAGETTAEMGPLNAPRIRRAMRHLMRSGRRLIQRRKDWAVVGASNAAIFALLTQEDVALMAAEKLIVTAEGGGYVAAPSPENPGLKTVPRTGLRVFNAVSYARRKQKSAGFAGLAIRAQAGEGPLTLRQAMAGRSFIADVEQSERGERITMNWSTMAVDGQRRRRRSGTNGMCGLARAALRANRRLARVRAELGEGAFALVWSACIEGASVRSLAQARGVSSREVQRRLSVALQKLAAAYDGVRAYDEA